MKLINAKLLIELECDECRGEGQVHLTTTKVVICSECDGSGYEQQLISLETLKHLLEGGQL